MATAASLLQILTLTDYDAVRHSIDISLDANVLPDSLIEELSYGPAAESELLARDPQALTYETTDPVRWQRVTRAAILFTAARLAPAVPRLTAETLGDARWQYQPFDPAERTATLRALAGQELAAYLQPDGRSRPLAGAWRAVGRRGY